jgi:hypothetical protein
MTDAKIQHLLAMCELHRLLDILGAPPGDYPVRRLREFLQEHGQFTMEGGEELCDCGWVKLANNPCRNPVHSN